MCMTWKLERDVSDGRMERTMNLKAQKAHIQYRPVPEAQSKMSRSYADSFWCSWPSCVTLTAEVTYPCFPENGSDEWATFFGE